MKDVIKLRKHYKELAKECGVVQTHYVRRNLGSAESWRNKVQVPYIKSSLNYSTALHELGHMYHGHTRCFADLDSILKEEIEAWDFAHQHAIIKINKKYEKYCLETYLYNRNPDVTLPHGNHRIWKRIGIKKNDFDSTICSMIMIKEKEWLVDWIARSSLGHINFPFPGPGAIDEVGLWKRWCECNPYAIIRKERRIER